MTGIVNYIPSILLSAVLPSAVCQAYTGGKHKNPPPSDNKCELISTFSLLTQASLGLLCLSCLIVKRFYEYPSRRSWPVWSFDVSKQLIGAMGLHVCNVVLSIMKGAPDSGIFAGDDTPDDSGEQDPCDWYFLNIVFDCTIGVFILYLVFEGVNKILQEKFHFNNLETGQYGPDPNKPSFRAFLKQLSVYFGSLMLTKVVLYYIMEYFSTPLLWFTSHVLLVWLNEYPDEFEIFIIMFVVPIFMNCLQLILVDTIIQNQLLLKQNTTYTHLHPRDREAVEQEEAVIDPTKSSTYGALEDTA